MLLATYQCNIEAELLWRRLCSIWAISIRNEDPQRQAWGDWRESGYKDLLTVDRRLKWDSEIALSSLEAEMSPFLQPRSQMAAAIARRRLIGGDLWRIRRHYDLDYEEAIELLECAKAYLYYACDSDSPLEVTELDIPL